ncbi:hypothetical protein EIP86_009112 [Pleurotus ostreatoroseus]|nr:hypothetical protein EIP86_009112 [Pleurotus ostreatoroseus]
MAALKINPERIERIVLSHWHSDHSGGILSVLRQRNMARRPYPSSEVPEPCVVDLHPDRPIGRGIMPPGTGKVAARLAPDPTFEEIEALGAKVETRADGHAVADRAVWVSGEIPRVMEYEKGLLGGMRWVQGVNQGKGEWVSEPHIMDERYAAIDVLGKGLVIFSSCSHAGIVNVVTDAVKTFKRPIHMVSQSLSSLIFAPSTPRLHFQIIGGLHLGGPELADRIEPTVDFFANKLRPSPTYILPMHCSGFAVKVALEQALGDGCVPASTGMRIEVVGSPESEKVMFPPVIA